MIMVIKNIFFIIILIFKKGKTTFYVVGEDMLSKNNRKLQAQKMEPTQQRFAIKKFTVGVASVLIGTTFAIYPGNTVVSADENTTGDVATELVEEPADSGASEATPLAQETPTAKEATASNAEVVPESEVTPPADAPPATTETDSSTANTDESLPSKETTTQVQPTDAVVDTPVDNKNEVQPEATPVNDTNAVAETEPTQPDPQWPASTDQVVTNDNGLYTPPISYNPKYYTLQANTGLITEEVAKGNVIPFSMAEHRSSGSIVTSREYRVRLQLDDRLANSVTELTLTNINNLNKVIQFTRIKDESGKDTNIWEAVLLDIFNEPTVGHAWLAEKGRIVLNDTIQNVFANIADVATKPLVYNAYVYDNSSRTALLGTTTQGYMVGPNDPLSDKTITPSFSDDKGGTKFVGSHNVITYDESIGDNGALVVFYQASKKGEWYNGKGLALNYGIDQALLPYLQTNSDGSYVVELNKTPNNNSQYGYVEKTINGKKYWVPVTYDAKNKVADLTLNADGTGSFAPDDLGKYVQFAGVVGPGRPAVAQIVYRLNKKLDEIYADLKKDGKAGGSLLFNTYFTDMTGVVQNYSLATNEITFDDSDGDGQPDIKEAADLTNPLVSIPNISDVYATETNVHGTLIFNKGEGNSQTVTVKDAAGNVYGTTTVTPEQFQGEAHEQAFNVPLTKALPAAGTKLIVSVESNMPSGDSVSNMVAQTNEVTIKAVTAKQDIVYVLGTTPTAEMAKAAIQNVADLPEDAQYTWATLPDTSKAGKVTGKVKITFPDKLDPTYTHELLVDVPVTVEDIFTGSKIEANTLMNLHVNQEAGNDAIDKETVAAAITKLTTKSGKVFTGDELKQLLLDPSLSYSWSDTPITDEAGEDLEARLRVSYGKRNQSWDVKINVIGAEPKEDQTTDWGVLPDAASMIANTEVLKQFDQADAPVSYAWKDDATPNVRPGVGEEHTVTGTIVVSYPDGTTQDVEVTLKVGNSQADDFTDKDKQDPQTTKITVHYNETIEAKTGILTPDTNNIQSVVFDTPISNTEASSGTQKATVTFNDGSTAKVDIPVDVVVATAKQAQTTPWGQVPAAKDMIANTDALSQFDQADTPVSYTWKQEPNVRPAIGSTDRTVTGIVTVTYPDGVTQDVEVTVDVEASDAERFLESQDPTTQTVNAKRGETVDTATAIDGITTDAKTKFNVTGATFDQAVDTSKAGDSKVPATVTFADGSTTVVDIPVTVTEQAQEYTPVGKETTTGLNTTPSAEDSVDQEKSNLPAGVTYSWKDGQGPDTSTKGAKQATVVVTYPDGSTDEVPVTVTVVAQNDQYTVEYPVTETVAGDGIEITPIVKEGDQVTVPPAGSTYSFKGDAPTGVTIDENTGKIKVADPTVATTIPPVVITYPDKTTSEVNVDLTVYPLPTAGSVNVDLNGTLADPEAKTAIGNANDLPDTATYTWKTPADTTTPGYKTGTVTVTYPNGTTKDVEVTVKVGSDEQIYTPEGQQVEVPLNGTPDSNTGIKNLGDLPQGTTTSWKDPVDTTTPGNKEGVVVVTYPDGSTEEVTVPVKVGTDAQITPPEGQIVEVPLNGTPDSNTGIKNFGDLPEGTTTSWKDPVDTTTPGNKEGTVVVTYPDGSTEEVKVPVKVGTDAQITPPEGKQVEVPLNGTPDSDTGIKNLGDLPQGTTTSWKDPVDTTTPGNKEGTIVVTYPDGSTEEVKVPVKVGTDAQITPPEGQPVEVPLNGTPDPTTGIKNFDDLPQGTTTSWKDPVDTTTPGNKEGVVVVTYPDGSTEEVTVPVKVGTDAQITPPEGQQVEVPLNGAPDSNTGIKNFGDLPQGTITSWKDPVDTTTPGNKEGVIVVTYPDGSSEEVKVPVKVGTHAQITPPEGQTVEVPLNGTPDSNTGIKNFGDLPEGTTTSWKDPVDTTTPGNKEGVIVVTYPDGSTEEVTVPVKVGTDAQITPPEGQPVEVPVDGTPDPTTGIKNFDDLPQGTTTSWKDPVDTITPGNKEGVIVVTYPDGSSEEVKVPVKVGTDAQINTPESQPVEVPVDGTPDPTAGIKNFDDMPEGTTTSWKDPVDTTTPGNKEGVIVVTYPDGSSEEVTVPVKVGTDAQITPPEGQPVKVPVDGDPDPSTGIKNFGDLPEGTTTSWKDPVDTTTPGNKEGTIVVTYPDGSSEEVKVPVKVGTDAQITPPEGQAVEVPVDGTPDPSTGIKNFEDMPEGTTTSWKDPVDTTTPGNKEGVIVVTYPDGSSEEVKVPVKVGTDAQITPPEGQAVEVPVDGTPDPSTGIKNFGDLPEGTTTSWKDPVDTTTPGNKEGVVVVTYPDGSTEEVTVPVKVGTDAQITPPEGQPVEVPVDGTPDPNTGIKNSDDLPEGTTTSWKDPVDTTTPGNKEGTIVVTYPDGSSEEVKVPVKVGTDAQINTPAGQPVEVPVDGTPDPTTGIKNFKALPEGTTTSWKDPVDTTTPGNKEGTIVVTYPDGSTEEVTVPVKVGTDAQITPPAGQAVEVPVDGEPDPSTGIKNFEDLPEGTTTSWKDPVDTTTPGNKEGVIVVTYPDGSTEEVTVPVKVGTDAQITPPEGQTIKVRVDEVPEAKTGIKNFEDLPEGTTTSWKDPVDTTTPGNKEGVIVVTYPDGSSTEVTVSVKVGTDAQNNDPKGQTVIVPPDGTPEAKTGIANFEELPVGTTVAWKDPVDTTTPGNKEGVIVVTYPDGSSEELTVPVKVGTDAELFEPAGQAVKVPTGVVPEAKDGIGNFADLPAGTTVTWKDPVDATTPGNKEGVIVVTYPDGSSEELTVPVKVGTDAEIYSPTPKPGQVTLGQEPNAPEFIENLGDLPAGTTVTWKDPVDATTPGNKEGVIVVTYPDGSSEIVETELTILAAAGEETISGQDKTSSSEVIKPVKVQNNQANSASKQSETTAEELPQTGDATEQKTMFAGMLTVLAGLLGFGATKRKKKDDEAK